MVRVQVPATTANMGPGFDCLGMALKLYNFVEMDIADSGVTIEIEGDGADKIPRDKSNIVYIAAERVFKLANRRPPGLRIRLTNNIPLARGLGSSAAAIVGGLIAANVLVGSPLSEKELLNLATAIEGHPDNVAPALLGGIVISVKEEEDIRTVKIVPPAELKCVVAIPDFQLSTQASREVLPANVTMEDAVFNVSRTAMLIAGLVRGDYNLLSIGFDDRLHQPYRANLVPGMKKVFAATKLAGAKGVALSGAGPTLIAFCRENVSLIAKVMKDTFTANGVRTRVMELEPNPGGARALEKIC